MTRVASMLTLAIAVHGLTAAEPQGEWIKSSGQGYEILFPAKPVEKAGKVTTLLELKRGPGKMLTVRIDVNPLPIDTTNEAKTKKLLDVGRDTILKLDKSAKVVAEKDITVGKHPGRDYEVEKPKYFTRQRTVLTPTKSYLINIVGPKEYVEGPEVDKFIESFKVKE